MKNTTYRIAAVAAVFLTLCLVFAAPVSAAENPNPIAYIGDTGYATLQDAIDNAASGAVITLVSGDITEAITCSNAKQTVTIQGNVSGTTLANTLTIGNTTVEKKTITVQGITFQGGAGLVIKGYTDVIVQNNKFSGITAGTVGAITLSSLGELNGKVQILNNEIDDVVDDGVHITGFYDLEITGNKISNTNSNALTLVGGTPGGEVTITGNTLTNWAQDSNNYEGYALRFQIIEDGDVESQLSFTGNTMKRPAAAVESYVKATGAAAASTYLGLANVEIDVSGNYWDGQDPSGLLTADIPYYMLIAEDGFAVGNTADLIGTYCTDEACQTSVKAGVAEVDDVQYGTLAEAVTNAEGKTVTLLKNINLGTTPLRITQSLTLDLNGFEISGNVKNTPSAVALVDIAGEYTVTIKNGKITNSETSTDSVVFGLRAVNGADVTINNVVITVTADKESQGIRIGENSGDVVNNLAKSAKVTITGNTKVDAGYAITIRGGYTMGGVLIVENGIIASGASYGISGNANYDNTTIIVNGGTIIGTNAAGIYHPQDGDLTINGGTITGCDGIQFVGSGKLTINGGTITGTHPEVVTIIEPNYNGAKPTGAALAIVNSTYKQSTNDHYQTVMPYYPYGTDPVTVVINAGTFTSAKNGALNVYGFTNAFTNSNQPELAGDMIPGKMKDGSSITITGGTFSSDPSAYLAAKYAAVAYNGQFRVQKMVEVSYDSSSSTPETPVEPEQPVEPETPAAPGEATVETTVTDGGEVAFETPAADGSEPAADAPVEIEAVVLPTGTDSEVAFIPVSEQPAPAGQEENTKKVFEINVPTYDEGKPATIKFTMTVAELEADGKTAADVALWHYDEETGEWTKLLTTFTIVDGIVYFEAVTFEFSPFAIIYADEEAPVTPETPVTPEEPETPASPAPVLAVFAALGAAAVLRRK